MSKIETTIEEIKNGKGILLEEYLGEELQNGESTLILKQGILYKIIEASLRKRKEPIIKMLHDNPNDIPIDIYNLYYENHRFFCYSIPFYSEYPTLYEVLKSEISLEERKQIALELIRIYQKLLKYKIIYFDWHSKNCLYKNDIKLLDIDSGILTTASSYDTKARRNLFILCIEILNAIDFDYDLQLGERKIEDLVNRLVDKEEMFLSRMRPLAFDFMEKEIQNYTNTMVEYKREIILKK